MCLALCMCACGLFVQKKTILDLLLCDKKLWAARRAPDFFFIKSASQQQKRPQGLTTTRKGGRGGGGRGRLSSRLVITTAVRRRGPSSPISSSPPCARGYSGKYGGACGGDRYWSDCEGDRQRVELTDGYKTSLQSFGSKLKKLCTTPMPAT